MTHLANRPRTLAVLIAAAFTTPAAPLLSQDSVELPRIKTAADLYAFENLLKIELTMKPEDWDEVRRQKRRSVVVEEQGKKTRKTLEFTYQRGDIRINGDLVTSVGIRKKGFIGSISSQRPSLKIKMHEYVKGQSFAGIKVAQPCALS